MLVPLLLCLEIKLLRWVIFLISLGLFACSGVRINPDAGDDLLFNQGLTLYEKKSYDKSAEAFKALINNYPESRYRLKAELLLADAFFAAERYDEAAEAYRNFRSAHPADPQVPYATFKAGLSHFKNAPSIDRDQSEIEKALRELEGLVSDFPSSEYVREAYEYITKTKERLAQREFYVGEFYWKSGKPKAALGRFYTILEKYSGTGLEAKSLLYIAKAHLKLGEAELARKALDVLISGYNSSPYTAEAKELLKDAGPAPSPQVASRGFFGRINPINLFRGNSSKNSREGEAVKDSERERVLIASLPKNPAPPVSDNPGNVSHQLGDADPPSAQGCITCHKVAPDHGRPRASSDSWIKRLFRWMGF